LIGCTNGVSILVAEEFAVTLLPVEVTVCADKVCESETIAASQAAPGRTTFGIGPSIVLNEKHEREVTVSLTVRSTSTGATIARATGFAHLARSQPNGRGCDPVCYGAYLTYDTATNTLEAA
jgi:hypothetical protein